MKKQTPEALIADHVFHISDEIEKLRLSVISNPDAVVSWIQFNLEHGDWISSIQKHNEELINDLNFFLVIDFDCVIDEIKALLNHCED